MQGLAHVRWMPWGMLWGCRGNRGAAAQPEPGEPSGARAAASALARGSAAGSAAGWLATHLVGAGGLELGAALQVARQAGMTSDATERAVITYLETPP